jgi:hypothetical protein
VRVERYAERMHRRRLAALALGLLALVLMGGFATRWLRPSSPISQANCDRVKDGMSETDVEEILGGPAGNYQVPSGAWVRKLWIGRDGTAVVYFDQNDTVRHVHFTPAIPRESLLEKIRRWLHL